MVAPWIKKKRAAATAPEVSAPAPVVAEEPAPKKAEAPKKPAKKVGRRDRLSKE